MVWAGQTGIVDATPSSLCQGYRYPVEVIRHCVWLYHRFPLSLREGEEMMLAHGVVVTYETIHYGLRRRRARPGDKWHLDEVFIKIKKARPTTDVTVRRIGSGDDYRSTRANPAARMLAAPPSRERRALFHRSR